MQKDALERKRLLVRARVDVEAGALERRRQRRRRRAQDAALGRDQRRLHEDERRGAVGLEQRQPPARAQDAARFFEHAVDVADVVQDVADEDGVEGAVAEGQARGVGGDGVRVGGAARKRGLGARVVDAEPQRAGFAQVVQVGAFAAADLEQPLARAHEHAPRQRRFARGDDRIERLPRVARLVRGPPIGALDLFEGAAQHFARIASTIPL
jgi:hypothetical protein